MNANDFKKLVESHKDNLKNSEDKKIFDVFNNNIINDTKEGSVEYNDSRNDAFKSYLEDVGGVSNYINEKFSSIDNDKKKIK